MKFSNQRILMSILMALLLMLTVFGVVSAQAGNGNTIFLPSIGDGQNSAAESAQKSSGPSLFLPSLAAGNSADNADDDAFQASDTPQVIIQVYTSANSPLSGVAVSYFSGYWRGLGTTNAAGQVVTNLPAQSWQFKADYSGTSTTQTQDTSVNSTVTFYTSEAKVQVNKSDGSPLKDVSPSYKAGYDRYFGHTDANGEASAQVFPGTYAFKADYGGTSATQSGISIPGDGTTSGQSATITFYTSEARVEAKDCSTNAPISGVSPSYKAGYDRYFGHTDANGEASAQVFPGTYAFKADYGGTSATQSDISIPGSGTTSGQFATITFNPTKVTLSFNGSKSYLAGYWRYFSGPVYLFPGTYSFKLGGNQLNITISGCAFAKTAVVLRLKDHNGQPLSGGTARVGIATPTTWFVSGSTDANGILIDLRDGTYPTLAYEMTYNHTTATVGPQNPAVNSIYDFQTVELTTRLETCSNAPLDSASIRYGVGPVYTTWWFPGGSTGSSAPGEAKAEVLPGGQYSFEMQYKGTAQTYPGNPVTIAGNTTLVWQTTNVSLSYNGEIAYGGPTGDVYYFKSGATPLTASRELLPGTYKFNFRPDNRVDLAISGCTLTLGKVLLKVLDENGGGVAGGQATPAYGGSWGSTLAGATDANGILFADIPPGFTKIKMVVNQGAQEQSTAQLTTSNYTWRTEILRIGLKDHTGVSITDQQATLDQGGGYWYAWGNLNASGYRDIQLFPASYRFKMTYNSTSYTQDSLVVSAGPGIQEFSFQTGQVFGSCITQYANGSWLTFIDGMELMPGTYTFQSPSQSETITAGGVTNLSCPE